MAYQKRGRDSGGFKKPGQRTGGYGESKSDNRGFEKRGPDNRGFEKKSSEYRSFDKKGTDNRGFEKKNSDYRGFEKKGPDNRGFEKKGSDYKGFEKKGPDNRGFEKKGSDYKGFEKKGPDNRGFEKKGSDYRGSEKKGPDNRGFEKKGSDYNGFEKKGPDNRGFEKKNSDYRGFEKRGPDNRSFEKKNSDYRGFEKRGQDNRSFERNDADNWGDKRQTRDPIKDGARGNYHPERKPEQPAPELERADTAEAVNENAPLIIFGRNTVREAIKSGKSIDKIYIVDSGSEDGSLREIMRMARDRKLVVSQVSREKLGELTMAYGYNGKPANHQGIAAQLPEIEYVEIDEILDRARQSGQPPFVLVLDSISDPHNLGGMIRSAECAGVHGVIIAKRRSVSVTPAVAKASAGAAMHMPVSRVPNLVQALEKLKEAGLWIAGADMDGENMRKAKLEGPVALVIGAEGEGLSRLIKEKCDFIVSIPMFGQINSLNASHAAAIIMYEKLRQDGK